MNNLTLYCVLWILAIAMWFAVLVLVPLAIFVDVEWIGWTLVGWIFACFVVLLVSVELWTRRLSNRE